MNARRSKAALLLAIAAWALAGCRAEEHARPDPPAAAAPSRVEIIAAPENEELPATVKRELDRARADGRELLVYVGATWCEPCQYFHKAAAAGELDAVFPGLRLLEFDLDRDRERLKQAGYGSRMIPLFAVPRADGTGSGQQIEGSIKGPGAVDEITPKLRGLLATARAAPR
jgi:thiol:disulfide interchange protein